VGDDFLASLSLGSSSDFDLFLARHNKHYPHVDEYWKRRAIHEANARSIEDWNREHEGRAKFAPNEFLDMTMDEIMSFRGGHIPRGTGKIGKRARAEPGEKERGGNLRLSAQSNNNQEHRLIFGGGDDDGDASSDDGKDDNQEEGHSFTTHEVPQDFDPATLPESFDWRDHLPGSVGPIKDQGFCGSCWAFSFVSAMESHWFIHHGESVDLPEQFVNDCSWSDAAHACDGGESGYAAISIVERFQGMVPTRDAYGGYLSVDGKCYVDILQDLGMMGWSFDEVPSAAPSTVRLTDWVVLPPRDDVATKHALFTKGPLSIALNVVSEALYYASGVLDVESCTKHDADNLDHAINLVGWGVDALPDGTTAEHWILRNSWSDLWGDSGYIKVRMGDRDCGITTSAGYPVVVPKQHSAADQIFPNPSNNVATN